MSKYIPSDFITLNLSGDNYLEWVKDMGIALRAKGLLDCIIDGNNEPDSEKQIARIVIRYYLPDDLKDQYENIKDPHDLWSKLKSRYVAGLSLPEIKHEWRSLRLCDFKSVDEYDSALIHIVSKLELCGEKITEKDLMEKTLVTFHPRDLLLAYIYREKGFTTYNDLLSCIKEDNERKHPEANQDEIDKEKSEGAVWHRID